MKIIVEVTEENILRAAQVHSLSWQDSHRSFCSAEFVASHTPENQAAYLRKEIARGKKVYMMIEDGPVGIVSVWNDLIENLYVLPKEQRKGYGTCLLLFAASLCEGAPALWVLSNNRRAYQLYSKNGFCETGKRTALSGSLFELEMKKDR